MNNPASSQNFRQSELDKFDELVQRWWGEAARSRTIGSRAAKRLRMDAQAGAMRHGWLGATA